MDSPKIPTLKDSQKPQVKVRGLEAGVTLFDRLKQFKKKDLAFILAGLGTLFMAPLAEHFMMAPEQGDALQAGMGGKGGSGSGLFNGTGSSPYEPGSNGLAQGSPSGGGSDIITPLNVRDPSALVMGPGATQQPPTQSVAPTTPPPTAPVARNDSDLKDALAASARGVGAAAKAAKALLPVPKVALQGAGGLRGLGVVSGGSSAVGSVGPINSSNSLSKANTGGGLSAVKAVPGYRGAAGSRGQSSGGSGLDALKAAADKAGERMNQGSAASALDATAAQGIPGGGSGLGGNGAGGTGGTDKPDGGNQDKSAKNVGESLDFLKQKAIQEAKIALWAKEQEANDMNLQMANMRNDALKTIVGAAATSIGTCVGNMVTGQNCVDPTKAASSYKCADGALFSASLMKATCDTKAPTAGFQAVMDGLGTYTITPCGASSGGHTGCVKYGASDAPKDTTAKNSEVGAGGTGGAAGSLTGDPNVTDLNSACAVLDQLSKDMDSVKANTLLKGVDGKAIQDYANGMKTRAQRAVAWRDALTTGKESKDCGATALSVKSGSVFSQQNEILKGLTDESVAGENINGLLPGLAAALKIKTEAPAGGGDVPAGATPDSLKDPKDVIDKIGLASKDVALFTTENDPQTAKPGTAPDTATLKKALMSMYSWDPSAADASVGARTAAFEKVNKASGVISKAEKTVADIQKDLDGRVQRIQTVAGPKGTVAQILPLDDQAKAVLVHAVFKRDKFDVGQDGLTADVKLGAGKPTTDLGIDGTNTALKKGIDKTGDPNSFQNYATAAADKKNDELFSKTNGVLSTAFSALAKTRASQVSEMGELNTTFKADMTKLSGAKSDSGSAK